MSKSALVVLLIFSMFIFFNCGPKIQVPPEIDLKEYSAVGIIQFSTEAKGKLGEFTTEIFLEEIQESQKGAQIFELGDVEKILDEVNEDKLSIESIKETGDKYEVDAIIIGDLEVSDVKPKVSLSTILSSMSVRADVDAKLTVKLYATNNGSTVWLNSARDKRTVAQVSIFSGEDIFFDAEDPDEAYGDLVRSLVRNVTRDLRFRYVRKKE